MNIKRDIKIELTSEELKTLTLAYNLLLSIHEEMLDNTRDYLSTNSGDFSESTVEDVIDFLNDIRDAKDIAIM